MCLLGGCVYLQPGMATPQREARAFSLCKKQSPVPGSFGIKTNVIIPWYITSQENMRFNLVPIVLLFIMFSPISSTILHNFIREKNDKRCYCFYYKCICSRIQLVLLFPCLMLPFSPRSCAGNACLSIPGILGKALTSLQEIHHSHNRQGDESPARGNCSFQEGAVGWEGLLGMFPHPLLRAQTKDEPPGDPSRVPGSGTFSIRGPRVLPPLPGAASGSSIPLERSRRTTTRSTPRCAATAPTGATGTCSPPSS